MNIQPLGLRHKLTAPVACRCGQQGVAIWEENVLKTTRGHQSELLEVSSGFYIRINKKDGSTAEIGCDRCERTVGISRWRVQR